MRSIGDCGKGIDWWSCTLPSLQERHGGDALQVAGNHLSSHSQVGGVISETARDGNKSLFGAASGLPLNLSHLPRCPYVTGMRLWSWRDRGMMWMWVKVHPYRRGCPGLVRLLLVLLQHQLGKKRRAAIIGDSFLRGTKGPICCSDPSHRDVSCPSGAWVYTSGTLRTALAWSSPPIITLY